MKPGGWDGFSTVNKFVYERSSDIGALKEGQMRLWLSRAEMRKVLLPYFVIVSKKTLVPCGDKRILRLVNSSKVNSIVGQILSKHCLRKPMECDYSQVETAGVSIFKREFSHSVC